MSHRITTPKAPATDAQRALIRTLAEGQGTDRHQPRIVPPKAATKARRIAGQPTTCKRRADECIRGLLTYPTVDAPAPKERTIERKPKAQPKTAMLYRIEVLKARGWAQRTIQAGNSPDHALLAYGIRGVKQGHGQRKSDSGKLFRALNTGQNA